MLGAIVMILLLVIFLPMGAIISGTVVAAILGTTLKDDGEARHEGSELIELNR